MVTTTVIKRDNSTEKFNQKKIENVLKKVFKNTHHKSPSKSAKVVTTLVLEKIEELNVEKIKIEKIQDTIRDSLIEMNYSEEVKEFIIFRNERAKVREFVNNKIKFIENYKKASNTANATVDDNSNVGNKNIGVLNAEIHKTDNIQINRGMVLHKLKELYPDFDSKNYLQDIENHIIYKHDESSFAGAIVPYCCSISMYPFLLHGLKQIGGLSASPKNLDSFCGMYINMIFAVAGQFAGACMYKDQEVFIKENGIVKRIKSKDLIEKEFSKRQIFSFENYQGKWEYVELDENYYILEDNRFVKLKKLYRRKYSDLIYKIKTKSGYECTVSKDHIFKQLYKGRFFEVKAKDLSVYDTVILNKDISCILNTDSKDWKLGWLDGMICGDGSITNDYEVRLSVNKEQEYLGNTFNEYLKEFCDCELDKRESKGNCFDFRISNKNLNSWFKERILGTNTYDKHIDINSKSIDYLLGFIDGLFCADGSYSETRGITISLSNFELSKNIFDIIQKLNIQYKGIHEIQREGNRKTSYYQYIPSRIMKYLYHTNKKILHRENKNTTDCSRELYYYGHNALKYNASNKRCLWSYNTHSDKKCNSDVIYCIETFNNDDNFVYEVETESHWYNCGGFITHNCATSEALVYFDYFARKDWGDDYYKDANGFYKIGYKLRKLLNATHYWTNDVQELSQHDFGSIQLNELRDEIVYESNRPLTEEELKEYAEKIKENPDFVLNLGDGTRTIKGQIHQYFQQIVYSINQPAASRGQQAAFVNFSYFDKAFFEGMFGGFTFPDGTKPQWESLSWLQKDFMMWFNEERTKCLLTFPVESFALVNIDGKWVDEDSANFVAEEYARGHSFFTYISDTVDSLSSCCFIGDEKIKIKRENNKEETISIKNFVERYTNTQNDFGYDVKDNIFIKSFTKDDNNEEYSNIISVLNKKYSGDLYEFNVDNNKITVTKEHLMLVQEISTGKIRELPAQYVFEHINEYLISIDE